MNWLNLSEGLFLFGTGGINRVEPVDERYTSGQSDYKTVLYNNLTKITAVKETVDEINIMLYNKE